VGSQRVLDVNIKAAAAPRFPLTGFSNVLSTARYRTFADRVFNVIKFHFCMGLKCVIMPNKRFCALTPNPSPSSCRATAPMTSSKNNYKEIANRGLMYSRRSYRGIRIKLKLLHNQLLNVPQDNFISIKHNTIYFIFLFGSTASTVTL